MFKRYFLTGLLVLVPLAITIWVLTSLIHFLDQTLIWLPYDYQPKNLFGFDIPGIGVLLTVAVILGIGLLASNLFGRQFLKLSLWHSGHAIKIGSEILRSNSFEHPQASHVKSKIGMC